MGTELNARPATPADVVRTLLTVAAILPGLLAGAWCLLRTRDRRAAMNRAIGAWGRLGLSAAAVELRVQGAEHLSLRPAVFILNHQSGFDPILLCALLQRDFVAVAKREIRSNPVLGPAFAFAGTVFVDRGDHADALRALQPAVETLRGGTAIAMAPEGTRSPGSDLGRFKKGAFRIAMAAGVPLVPIVIHDAGMVLPQGGWIMRSGVVNVSVLAPLETSDWSLDALDQKVEEVEAAYRLELSHR
jgi:1-acyl-sn-glycerol-3-phosphate acyltransferase